VTARPEGVAIGTSGPHHGQAYGILTIDLDAIVDNWRDLRERCSPAACAAVVKADGYGCGIDPVTSALAKAGCTTFFVADFNEGRRVRRLVPDATIYVFNGLMPGAADNYAKDNLQPVLGSLVELGEWKAFCEATGWSGHAALHVDTGINRLGLRPEQAARLAEHDRFVPRRIDLLMSHFACADEPGHPLNAKQMAAFRDIRGMFPAIPGSLANSSGIFLGPDAHHDLVRPGVALYGANPTPGHLNLMRPVVRLEAGIVQVRDVPQGETVGYGATWTATRPVRLAVVGIGYADGFLRAAGASDQHPGATALVGGHPCPLAGRISMDLLAVDVTGLAHAPSRGDRVTLIGEQITVDTVASHAGTIGYEVLTSLGPRYHRVYRGG